MKTLLDPRVFKTRCKVCQAYMAPAPLKGFEDRIRFTCIKAGLHPQVISLLSPRLKKKWTWFAKRRYRAYLLHDHFLRVLDCYLRNQDAVGNGRKALHPCGLCSKKGRELCKKVETLDDLICGPINLKVRITGTERS